MEILGDVKNYDWGKLGKESEVSKLASLNDVTFVSESDKTYSELWMGDHVSGPSKLKKTGELLGDFLVKDCAGNIGGQKKLPFLFKVLSIRKALSIQCHPNKEEAEKLHAARPDLYKDPNHKPELAIALTPFLALCGFRPHDEIYSLLKSHNELIKLIGESNIELIKNEGTDGLKKCYSKLMKSNADELKNCIEQLVKKFSENDISNEKDKEVAQVFLRLNQDFPNDVGSLSLFFLNLIKLNVGDAIYLAAKVPHAYLDGDCIECMACSDNVVRAGLTPKFKDVDVLLDMLVYEGATPSEKLFKPKVLDEQHKYTLLFKPEIQDFAVAKISVS